MPRLVLLCLLSATLSPVVLAQQAGQIVGVVTDSSGAVVPGATIKVVEAATGFTRSTIAGSDGQYVLPSLRPTQYGLTAESFGFRAYRHSGFELMANQSLTINVTLDVGTVSETVNVTGAAVQVNTTTATLSDVVDQSRIIELPLNGRDAARLSTLVAGTVIESVSTETGKSIPGGLRLSSNGSQQRQVAFKLDGASNTVVERLRDRCPGFLEQLSTESARLEDATTVWRRLIAWVDDRTFGSAKAEGWFEAITFFARHSLQAERTVAYWAACDLKWSRRRPAEWPGFEEWRRGAEAFTEI